MKGLISKEEPFKVIRPSFTIAATSAGYQLEFASSKDSDVWTSVGEKVPANENLICNGMTPLAWARLKDNVDDDVEIIL